MMLNNAKRILPRGSFSPCSCLLNKASGDERRILKRLISSRKKKIVTNANAVLINATGDKVITN